MVWPLFCTVTKAAGSNNANAPWGLPVKGAGATGKLIGDCCDVDVFAQVEEQVPQCEGPSGALGLYDQAQPGPLATDAAENVSATINTQRDFPQRSGPRVMTFLRAASGSPAIRGAFRVNASYHNKAAGSYAT